jgi:hypothetical protein
MKTQIFVLMIALLTFHLNAQAVVIASGSNYAGANQRSVVCNIYNTTGTTVTIGSRRIISRLGVNVPVQTTCGTTIAANTTCTISALVSPNETYACRVDVSSTAAVRGSFELRNVNNTVLIRADMR